MRRVVIFAMLLAVLAAACGGSDGSSAVYDGTGCTYEGPTEFTTGTAATFTFTNESDTQDVTFGLWQLPEGTTQADILANGINVATNDQSMFVLFAPSLIGDERSETYTFQTPGRYAVDCTDFSGGENNGQGLSYITEITVTE